MTAVAVESVLGANGAVLEEQASGVEAAGEAGVVESDGVPAVASVDVDSGLEEVAEPVDVSGARGFEDVSVGDSFGRQGWAVVLEVDV